MVQEKRVIYGPKELALLLGIEPVTLRNYAKIMESKGYVFHKNERGQRGYIEQDIIAFKKLIAYKEKPGMTLERSANAVMSWAASENKTVSAITAERVNQNMERLELLKEFEEFKAQQLEFNQRLLIQLEIHQNHIKEALKERDQNLIEAAKEILKTKKQMAASEIASTEAKKRWWRFW